MSMLAERKRRVPRVNVRASTTWSNDESKLGQRLLEKMGWEKGRGLGTNLEGSTAALPMKLKLDSQGLGFTAKDDQWTSHETLFQGLLSDLNGGSTDSSAAPSSLEKKSKNLQSRIHYRKFTRGKDISQYSSKDLANIFGKRSLDRPAPQEEIKEVVEDSTPSSGYNFVAAGSIGDYFSKLQSSKSSAVSERNEDSCEFMFRGFSDARASGERDLESNGDEENDSKRVIEKIDNCDGHDLDKVEIKKKKKKRKMQLECLKDEETLNNLECSAESQNKSNEILFVKKKKKKVIENIQNSQPNTEHDSGLIEENDQVSTKKKRKRDENAQNCLEHFSETQNYEIPVKKKKKKQKK